jgi:spermidine/putrescine transport system permease protein
LAVSHRIAVMNGGRVEQVGAPEQIYGFPRNRFVADFIGTINLLPVEVRVAGGDALRLVANGLGEIVSTPVAEASAGQRGAYAVRPERVRIFSAGDVCELDNHFQGTVREHLYLGDVTVYKIALDNGAVLEALLANSPPDALVSSNVARWSEWAGTVAPGSICVTESRQAGRSPGPGENLQKWLVSLPPTLFLLVFFVAPALLMVVASFQQVGDFGGLVPVLENGQSTLSLEAYRFFFGDWIYAEIFLRSFLVAAATTLLCLLLAYPLALLIATGGKRHRDLLVLLVILPLASNFLIRIYAWMIVLGPAELLYTPFAVIVGMVYVHLPFMILPLYTNLESHDPALLEAAQDLGAGAWTRFWRITLPLSLPGVWSGSALVFIPVLGMFAIPELLGGTRDILIGNLIKEQFLDNRDWPLGSTLSILLTAAVLLLAWLAAWAGRPRRGRA